MWGNKKFNNRIVELHMSWMLQTGQRRLETGNLQMNPKYWEFLWGKRTFGPKLKFAMEDRMKF